MTPCGRHVCCVCLRSYKQRSGFLSHWRKKHDLTWIVKRRTYQLKALCSESLTDTDQDAAAVDAHSAGSAPMNAEIKSERGLGTHFVSSTGSKTGEEWQQLPQFQDNGFSIMPQETGPVHLMGALSWSSRPDSKAKRRKLTHPVGITQCEDVSVSSYAPLYTHAVTVEDMAYAQTSDPDVLMFYVRCGSAYTLSTSFDEKT
jgi:hypothetical protein